MRIVYGCAIVVLCTTGCELPFDFGPGDDRLRSPDCSGATVTVAGTWRIEGSGRRQGCDDPSFDTDELQVRAERLPLVQNGTRLELASKLEGFSLSGEVDGQCVYLDTDETVDGLRTQFRFEGERVGSTRIEGTFTGEGPGACVTEGEFVARTVP